MAKATIETLKNFLETLYLADSTEGTLLTNEAAIQVMIMCNDISSGLKERAMENVQQNESNCNKHDVSQRSELLAFMNFISKTLQQELEMYSNEELVDGYLKANCG